MKMHLIGGWAFPASACHAIADRLAGVCETVTYDFTFDPLTIKEPDYNWWLAGWSLGGMLALDAIVTGALKPKGLILISSTSRFCADATYPCGVNRAALRVMMSGLRSRRDETLSTFFADAAQPGVPALHALQRQIIEAKEFSNESLLNGLTQLDKIDLRSRLSSLTCPTLLLHGSLDRIIPPTASQFMELTLPNARLQIVPQAGHDLPIACAQTLSRSIISFIS